MEPNTLTYIIGGIALLVGIVAGKLIFAKNTQRRIEEAEQQAQKIVNDAQATAENLKKEKILEAKERFVQMKAEHDKEVLERNRKLGDNENRTRQKEQSINQKLEQLEKQVKDNEAIKDNLSRQIEVVNHKRTELEKHQEEHIRRLEKIAGLTAEEAKVQLVESLKQDMKFDSDKKEDMDGQLGQAFKGKIGVPKEFSINKEGVVTAIKNNGEKTEDPGGMMGGMMSGAMGSGEEKEGSSFNSLANIPSKGVKVGESWNDSTSDENGKTFTTYTLKEVSGGNGLVTLSANTALSRELEQQGMTMQMDMTGTTIGEYTFEVATGIIKTRKATSKSSGTIAVAGQSMPVSIESTVQSTVNKK